MVIIIGKPCTYCDCDNHCSLELCFVLKTPMCILWSFLGGRTEVTEEIWSDNAENDNRAGGHKDIGPHMAIFTCGSRKRLWKPHQEWGFPYGLCKSDQNLRVCIANIMLNVLCLWTTFWRERGYLSCPPRCWEQQTQDVNIFFRMINSQFDWFRFIKWLYLGNVKPVLPRHFMGTNREPSLQVIAYQFELEKEHVSK